MFKRFFGKKEKPMPKKEPEKLDYIDLLDSQIDSAKYIPDNVEGFIAEILTAHCKNYLNYLVTKKEMPLVYSVKEIIKEMENNVEDYTKNIFDDFVDQIDTYLGWIESDLEDYQEDTDWDVKSICKTCGKDEDCTCTADDHYDAVYGDEPWDSENPDVGNPHTDKFDKDIKPTKKEKKPTKKEEVLRDWNNDW